LGMPYKKLLKEKRRANYNYIDYYSKNNTTI